LNRIREKVTYANVMASVAVFLALGGGAFALTHRSKSVKGGGKIVSVVKDVNAGADTTILKLSGLGKISVGCGTDAKTSSWGFTTGDRAAYIALTDGNGSRVAGHGHGFTTSFGHLSAFSSAYVAAHISGTAGHPKPLANVTLSVVNDGFTGAGDNCRFAVQSTRQP
jgi:hypothetical protein